MRDEVDQNTSLDSDSSHFTDQYVSSEDQDRASLSFESQLEVGYISSAMEKLGHA